LFSKVFQVGDDGLCGRTQYFSMVDLVTSMPSLRSFPTIRGEPQLGALDSALAYILRHEGVWRATDSEIIEHYLASSATT
jgi:hypothetical protein